MASHEELIKAGSFDEKFKNALRDYYTYGFKTYTELQTENEKGKLEPSESTINADWMRLNNILFDYFDWSIDKKKAFFMSADSQSMVENPFHRVFRFCKYNSEDPKAFFNIVFALSSKMELVTSYLNQQLFDILDIDLEKEAEKRSRIQAVDFLIAYPTAELIQEGEKVSCFIFY